MPETVDGQPACPSRALHDQRWLIERDVKAAIERRARVPTQARPEGAAGGARREHSAVNRSSEPRQNMAKALSDGVAHDLPEDLRKALRSDPTAVAIWETLTPLARNEWICWVVSVKKPETRREHVKRVRSELHDGMRRPCCFMGCVHRSDKPLPTSLHPSRSAVRRASQRDSPRLHKTAPPSTPTRRAWRSFVRASRSRVLGGHTIGVRAQDWHC
jgi:Bacteriocin-protection, YdeI or OmpD-Associated